MSLFCIADLHLSFHADKSMEVFRGWERYTQRLEENWKAIVSPEGHGRAGRGYLLGHEAGGYPGGFRLSPFSAGKKS